jgi:hypothetical protein
VRTEFPFSKRHSIWLVAAIMFVPHVIMLCFFCFVVDATAYVKDYLPIADADLRKRVFQEEIPIDFVENATARFGSDTIRLGDDGTVVISGKDKSGKPWEFRGRWTSHGGAFYTADLDQNGSLDLLYASYAGGNGLAPSMHLTTLLFDRNGRPVPSEMDGYFELDSDGLKDLVDLNGDGRAELIRQSFNDGYWITSLYDARDARWWLVHGKQGRYAFPLYARFTTRPNRIATTPNAGRHPVEDDLANGSSSAAAADLRITSVQWARVEASQDPTLRLSDGRICQPTAWYSTMSVMIDSPERRVEATLSDSDYVRELLNTIVAQGLSVQVLGHRGGRSSDCIPEFISAKKQ